MVLQVKDFEGKDFCLTFVSWLLVDTWQSRDRSLDWSIGFSPL